MGSNSSRSTQSSESSRNVGGGSNVDLCLEKYDNIQKIQILKNNENQKIKGFILKTEYFYYAIKCINKNFSSYRSKDIKKCVNFIDDKYDIKKFKIQDCEFSSGLTLEDIEKKVSNLISNNCKDFNNDLLEKISNDCKDFNKDLLEKEKTNKTFKKRNISVKICKDKYDKIRAVTKIIVPYKFLPGVIVGRIFASIFTLGFINISEDLRQLPEHHGLVFKTDNFYYAVHYTNGGISTMRSKNYTDCIDEIISGAGNNSYDDKRYDIECQNCRSGLNLGIVEDKVKYLIPYFNESNYHSLKNNCQYFVKDLLERIS